MRKIEIVQELSNRIGAAQKDVNTIITSFCETITAELAKGGKVQIPGFGTFEAVPYAPRKGRNPQTGEVMSIPGGTRPKFTPGTVLKKAVQG